MLFWALTGNISMVPGGPGIPSAPGSPARPGGPCNTEETQSWKDQLNCDDGKKRENVKGIKMMKER